MSKSRLGLDLLVEGFSKLTLRVNIVPDNYQFLFGVSLFNLGPFALGLATTVAEFYKSGNSFCTILIMKTNN